MRITYDPPKRDRNVRDRKLDFEDAALVFAGRNLTRQDTRVAYSEPRFQTVGFLADRMVMVVWTPRGENRHVMSMRKCNDREQKTYQEQFGTG